MVHTFPVYSSRSSNSSVNVWLSWLPHTRTDDIVYCSFQLWFCAQNLHFWHFAVFCGWYMIVIAWSLVDRMPASKSVIGLVDKITLLLLCLLQYVHSAGIIHRVSLQSLPFWMICFRTFHTYASPEWPTELLCYRVVRSSYAPYVRALFAQRVLSDLWTQYFESEWTDLSANWRKWSPVQGRQILYSASVSA